jgi:CRP/FNR family transcriptional regulator
MVPVEQLRHYPLFANLNDVELARVAPLLTKRVFAQGAYIYYPGNPALNSYLVESGMVRLFITNAAGEEFLVNLIKPLELFGYPTLEDNQLRLLGAAVHRSATVLSIGRADFFEIMEVSPQFLHNVYLELSTSARKLLLHVRMLVTLSLNGRLATMILHLAGDGEAQERIIELPFSQGVLAGWVGASRGRVNRALAQLQQMGLIELDGHKMVLLDRAGLELMAEEQTLDEP